MAWSGVGSDGPAWGRKGIDVKYKNPRRVAAGKMAYHQRKSAQDEADQKVLQIVINVIAIAMVIVVFGLLMLK